MVSNKNFDVAVMIALSISVQPRKLGHRLLKFSAESRYEFLNSHAKLQPEPPGNLKKTHFLVEFKVYRDVIAKPTIFVER